MKKHLVLAAVATTFCAQAQNLQEAITKTENERFEAAAADFKALLAKDPGKGDYYFYYGENFYKNDNPDSAMIMYKKGSEAQPTNPLNFIGIGKVLLSQGKDQDANTNLFKGKTLGAKNATAYMKLAEVYINAPAPYKNLIEANKLLTDAMKWESKNPEAHILMGDALLEQNPTDGGPAIKEYDKALELNPKSPKAILREGKLWSRARNYNLALESYKKAIGIDPTFAPAYREIAEIYHLAGQHEKALEMIKKYLELNQSSPSAHKRYASFLFLNKNYADAVKEIEDIVKKDPNDCYMWRLLGYAYSELGNAGDKEAYTKGLDAINKFFACAEGKNFKYIPDDYKYKGVLLGKTGQDSLGAVEIEKAITQDPVKNCELYGEIGRIYTKAKKYEKAIDAYEKKEACPGGKGLNAQDNFELGRDYFSFAGMKVKEKKETEAMPLFVKADTAFAHLVQLSPNFPTGYFWRGRTNSWLDQGNEKGLAFPYYDKYVNMIKPEERATAANKFNVIEAYEYLGYYYLKKKENAKAKECFTIVKEIDPNNQKAKDFFKSPEGK
jgi:tetratricopeptide (TPR) repeat protein